VVMGTLKKVGDVPTMIIPGMILFSKGLSPEATLRTLLFSGRRLSPQQQVEKMDQFDLQSACPLAQEG